MAKTLKTRGMEDLKALQRRIDRQFALSRISRKDWEKLRKHANSLEGIIVEMKELNEYGQEEGESEW